MRIEKGIAREGAFLQTSEDEMNNDRSTTA